MTPNPQDSAVALEVERAAFEAHYAKIWKERGGKTESIAELVAVLVIMRDGNEYDNGQGVKPAFINNLWQGWQARASQSDGTSGVPDGLKLAPMEPTDEMLKAGRKAIHDSHSVSKKALLVYQAMLAAAPNQGENHVG